VSRTRKCREAHVERHADPPADLHETMLNVAECERRNITEWRSEFAGL